MARQTYHPGQQLGNYRLVRLLGKGGFAEVYLGEHIHLNTQVAVKVLLTSLEQESIENFRNEARTIAHLVHPHIVQVRDFGIVENTPYLAMDYAPNGTLRQRHPRGTRLPLPTIVSYVQQVAEALQYAHEQRLIHRDIKPENMLLGRNNEVLLSDFGIALVAQSSHYQSTQNVAGTIVYMAPEQIHGHPRPASDQYALGVVVYEWLSGNRPFQGSFTEVAVQHTMAPPPPLRAHLPTISPALEEVVLIALNKDPQQRFPSVRAFAQALEQTQQAPLSAVTGHASSPIGMPMSGQPSGQTPVPNGLQPYPSGVPHSEPQPTPQATPAQPVAHYPSQPSPGTFSATRAQEPRRFSRRAALVGVVGLAAVAGSGLTWVVLSRASSGNGNPTTGGSDPTHTQANPIPATAALVTYQGHTEDLKGIDWSPDGHTLATVAEDGTAQIWSADTGKQTFSYRSQVTPAQSDDTAMAIHWSSNGQMLIVAFADGTAQTINATNGTQISSYGDAAAGTMINSAAWSPDGQHLALANSGGVVLVYETASGKVSARFTGHRNSVLTVAWSHDGSRIASGSEDATVQVWKADTGQALLNYKEHMKQVPSVAWSPDDSRIVSCSWDNTVKVWEPTTGHTYLTYTRHKSGLVNAVAWSHNGTYIASGGEVAQITGNVIIGTRGVKDVNTHVWEAKTGTLLSTYQTLPTTGIAWAPDDSRIATANTNNIAQVWRVK